MLAPAGTTCRAAANTCDLVETCTGLSTTCPPDLSAADGTPCNDGLTCTSPDSCQAGLCTGPSDPDACTDDFLCYKTRGVIFEQILDVTLVDHFESVTAQVVKPKHICLPANKNGEGVLDPVTHVQTYLIRQTPLHVKQSGLVVTNQIGSITLDTIKGDLLLVPTAKSLSGPASAPAPGAHSVEHYKCYKVKVTTGTPKLPRGTQVTITDQFTPSTGTFDLKKPKHLCTPVNKNGEGITNPNGHLLCYIAKPARNEPKHTPVPGINTNNQFGPLVLETIKTSELCIPSSLAP
jgi:hypothetical protein